MPRRQTRHRAADWAVFHADRPLGVELLHARFATHAYEPHSHDAYVFGLIEGGLQTFRYRRTDHRCSPGTVFALDPGELHDGRAVAESGFIYRAVHLAPDAVRGALADLCDRDDDLPSFGEVLLRDDALPRLIRRLQHTFAGSSTGLQREAALTEFLAAALSHRSAPRRLVCRWPSDLGLDRVRQALDADPLAAHSSAELAALAGSSRFHLLRGFQRRYGLTPHGYQRQLRLREARRLLAAGQPPAEVASATGFADQSHLNKRFKGAFGITPGQYRAALAAGSVG